MIEKRNLEYSPLHIEVCQMYDYVKLAFAFGCPFTALMEITLSDADIDWIINNLNQAKNERNSDRP